MQAQSFQIRSENQFTGTLRWRLYCLSPIFLFFFSSIPSLKSTFPFLLPSIQSIPMY